MHDIQVKLWRMDRQQDWSAEINGIRYESVSIDVIEGLVQNALCFGDAWGSENAAPQPIQ